MATILSAQTTDVRVNMVTPELFRRFPTPAALADAEQEEVEELVRSTGFYRNKAKNIIGFDNTFKLGGISPPCSSTRALAKPMMFFALFR